MPDYDDRTRTTTSVGPTPTGGAYDDRTTTYRDPASTVPYQDRSSATAHEHRHATHGSKNVLDWLAIVLLIVGGLNWGLVGLLDIDLVATLFGQGSMLSRVVYIAVGLAAIWGFALMRLSPANRNH